MAHKPGFFRQALSTVAQPFKEMIASFRGGRKKTTKEQKYYPEVCAAYLEEARHHLNQGNIDEYICTMLGAHYADRRNLVAQSNLESIAKHKPALFEKYLSVVPEDPDYHLEIFMTVREPEIIPFDFDLESIVVCPPDDELELFEITTEPRAAAPSPERINPAPPQPEPETFAPRKVGFAAGHRMWKKVRDEQDRRAGIRSETLYSGDGSAQLKPTKQEIIPTIKNSSFQEIEHGRSAQVSGDLTVPYTPDTPDAPKKTNTPNTVYRVKSTGIPFTSLQS